MTFSQGEATILEESLPLIFLVNCSYALIQHWLTTPIKHLQYAQGKFDQEQISGKGIPIDKDLSEKYKDAIIYYYAFAII